MLLLLLRSAGGVAPPQPDSLVSLLSIAGQYAPTLVLLGAYTPRLRLTGRYTREIDVTGRFEGTVVVVATAWVDDNGVPVVNDAGDIVVTVP